MSPLHNCLGKACGMMFDLQWHKEGPNNGDQCTSWAVSVTHDCPPFLAGTVRQAYMLILQLTWICVYATGLLT